MINLQRLSIFLCCTCCFMPFSAAAEVVEEVVEEVVVDKARMQVEFEIPVIDTAEYHRPYVAVWIENNRRQQVVQLALWLEQEKWHRDLRSWWRRGGSQLALPLDGVSGATRKPGQYQLSVVSSLPRGSYSLNVEAVREVGGREHIRIPFDWSGLPIQLSRLGDSELGAINLSIEPENQP